MNEPACVCVCVKERVLGFIILKRDERTNPFRWTRLLPCAKKSELNIQEAPRTLRADHGSRSLPHTPHTHPRVVVVCVVISWWAHPSSLFACTVRGGGGGLMALCVCGIFYPCCCLLRGATPAALLIFEFETARSSSLLLIPAFPRSGCGGCCCRMASTCARAEPSHKPRTSVAVGRLSGS